jgi:carboxyl-terminal processing protease
METAPQAPPNPAPENKANTGAMLKNVMLGMAGVFIAILIFIVGLTVGVATANGFRFTGASAFPSSADSSASIGASDAASGGLNTVLINDVIRRLRAQWYGDFPSSDKLTDGAISGMVNSLGDPFTAYVAPQYARILEQDMTSKFEGIGATLRQASGGAIQILRTFEGSPARKAGVLPGDIIDAVDGKKVSGLNTTEVAALVRGPKGTAVKLTLRRADQPKPFDLTITRDTINIPLVTGKMVADSKGGQIAYVSLYDFSQEASTQLNDKLKELLKQNPKGLIFDLRDNPGGYLSQAVDVGSIFLKQGVLVIERDNKGNERKEYTSGKGVAQDIPLVVLVNSGSASAAEIVAGAIQDYGRAKLIGETTFGKGSVQSPQSLSNGGQLRITIQHWYTPRNRGIHGTGITPDYVVVRSPVDEQAGRDPQLDAALNYLLSGKTPPPTPIPTVPATPAP